MNLLNLLKIIINYKGHTKSVNRSLTRLKMCNFSQKGVSEEKRKEQIIVSLTSYGERLKDADLTLYSLLNQNLKPDRVILWLDKEKFNIENLPKTITKFIKNGLEIKFCEDIKSYTKLIPAVKNFPEAIIVTADDDVYYKKDWLEKLYNSYLKYPEDIHCHRAHLVKFDENKNLLSYETWEKCIEGESVSTLNFLTGVGGVLYPPNCFDETGLDYNMARILSPNADDVWFWLMAIKNNLKIRVVKNNESVIFSTNILRQSGLIKEKTLYSLNKNGGNDAQINEVLTQYPEIKDKLVKNRTLKLLFDASVLSSYSSKNGYRAGVFVEALNLLKQFIEMKEFEVTLYADYKSFRYIKRMVTDLPEFSDLKIVTQQNLMNKFIGNLLFWVESFPRKIFYTCAVLSRIYDVYFYKKCRLLEKELEKYDVYFSPFTPPCDEIRNSKKIKRFSCIQDIIPVVENDTEKSFIPKWHHKLYKNINGEDFYFAISEYTRDDVLKYFGQVKPENIVTAHLGADEKFFPCTDYEKIRKVKTKYNIPNDYSYILSLCTLGKRKNIPFLIKAYAEFIKLHKEEKICLVLAGGKWKKFEKELKESLKGLDKKSIIQTGYVNDEDLPYLLSGAKVFVFPSLYEGFGLPVLEAMQCGCPVIVSNLTSLPEVVGDAGILINVCGENSQANLVTELEKMCFDNNFRNEYAGKALDQAKLFSWQKCARIITENIKKRVFSEN